MPTRRRALVILCLLLLLAGASFVVALAAGSIPVTFHDLLAALFGGALDRADENTLAVEVIRGLRLPRALGAFACGGLLALAGGPVPVVLRHWGIASLRGLTPEAGGERGEGDARRAHPVMFPPQPAALAVSTGTPPKEPA